MVKENRHLGLTSRLVRLHSRHMRSPVTVGREFLRKRAAANALYQTLLQHGRPGGIDVSRQDAEGVAALMHLLKHRNDVTVVKNKQNLMLMFKIDLERTFTPGVAEAMSRGGVLANPGEDLLDG